MFLHSQVGAMPHGFCVSPAHAGGRVLLASLPEPPSASRPFGWRPLTRTSGVAPVAVKLRTF